MDNKSTISLSSLLPIIVKVENGRQAQNEFRFSGSFRIGRSKECELILEDECVSKLHAEVHFEDGHWWIADYQSTNGTFLNGQPIQRAVLPPQARLELGRGGVVLALQLVDQLKPPERSTDFSIGSSVNEMSNAQPHPALQESGSSKFFTTSATPAKDDSAKPVGLAQKDSSPFSGSVSPSIRWTKDPISSNPIEQTTSSSSSNSNSLFQKASRKEKFFEVPWRWPSRSPTVTGAGGFTQNILDILGGGSDQDHQTKIDRVRDAAHQLHRQRSRKFLVVIAVVTTLALFLGGYAWYLHVTQIKEADAIFYSIKTMELELAQLEEAMIGLVSDADLQKLINKRKTIQAKYQDYDRYLQDLGIFSSTMSKEDRLIYRMTFLFGENVTKVPPDFIREVKNYISKWQSTPRLSNAIRRALRHHYPQKVAQTMLRHQMPPQFFYLGLQESNFALDVVGPKTSFGIAKGPWQFIPLTAREYGLKTGPLVDHRQFDPRDERHDFLKSTEAAAQYIKHLYTTEAQASGLLVMASYNWGEGRVRKRINEMPQNPRERNFWKLLKEFKIPKETYDYVFYIFSAAVIGENPRLFGFDFDNPFAHLSE